MDWPPYLIGLRGLRLALLLPTLAILILFTSRIEVNPGVRTQPKEQLAVPLTLTQLAYTNDKDRLLQEQAFLQDPTPLFLPTAWNSGRDVGPKDTYPEPGLSFSLFPAKLVYEPNRLQLQLPAPVQVPQAPVQELNQADEDRPLVGFSQGARKAHAFTPRSALLELQPLAGTALLVLTLEGLALPENQSWQPAEFLAAAESFGLSSSPVLLTSSGLETIDRLLEEKLVRLWPRIERRARLGPGFYRIHIGP